MSAPISEQLLATIRADLAAVPAPPWRWIGVRGAGGPQLVTDHSGRQYLLRAKKPADHHGDELLDPQTDYPVYGDLEFRDQRPGEQYSTMRAGDRLAVGRTSYDEDSIVGVDNPVARWVERSTAHAAALLAEVERLQATAPSVWHAWFPEDASSLGFYAGRDAAMDHIHHLLAREENTTPAAIEVRVMWRADNPEAEDTAWECWLTDPDGADDTPTGYVVNPIAVAATYEPSADVLPDQPTLPETCGQCRHPFDATDTRWDGSARHGNTEFCRACTDRCHDTEIADHRCKICATPAERGERP
jgi:hypothetical protein